MSRRRNRTVAMGLLGFALTAAWSSTARAGCDVSGTDETVCDAETVAFTEQFVDGSLRGFQPPVVNGNDAVGYIAGDESLFDYSVFVREPGGALLDALVSGDTAEGSFAGIRVSTLDEYPMFSMDDAGNVYGMANVLDEFGGPVLGLVRGGSSGYRLFEDPASFDAGTFINLASTTEALVNDVGTLAFRAEIRRDAGATIVGEGLFLGTSAVGVLAQTGDAAADPGETFLGFLSGLNARTLALNDLGGVAFGAIVSGPGVDAASDERLIAFDGVDFVTLAREGGAAIADTPNLSFGGSAPNTFGWVGHNTAGDTAFLARLTEGVAASEFTTGGSGGATDYDGLFVADTVDEIRGVAVRGNDASAMFDDLRYVGDQFITHVGPGRLNNSGEVAFFANAGVDPLGTDSLGLFVYDIESDAYTRIFQTSGSTFEDIFSLGDSIDGLTFSPTTEAFFNELAINDEGDLAFTADVFAEIGSPTRRGLFVAGANGLQTVALEGAEIDVAGGGLRTISLIEFLGGSTSSGRPSGLGDSGAVAFGLVFDDGASGVFLDTFEPVVVQDFLWSGDCGSSNWHDGCSSSNWDNRNTGHDAPRTPGSDPADRVFIVDADVILADEPVDLFSIDATGSLAVRAAMSLGQASSIDNLTLEADLSSASALTLSGSDGLWLSGTISGAGSLSLLGTATETGRLVVDTDDVVTLDSVLTVGSIGDLAVDDGTLNLGANGSVLVDGLDASLNLTGGRITQAASNPAQYTVDSTGRLFKAGSATAVIEAGYRQTDGTGLISGGELIFTGDVLLGMETEVVEGGTLTFAGATGTVWQDATFSGAGVVRLEDAALDARGNVSVDLADGGELVLDGGIEIVADSGLDIGTTTSVRKTGQATASASGLVLRGEVNVDEGALSVSRSQLLGGSVAVASGATLVFEDEPTAIGDEVVLSGAGLAHFNDVRINDDPASDEGLLVLDLDNLWDGVTWQGVSKTVLGDPNITEPSLTVRNRQSVRVEPGSTATMQTVIFLNGESPGILLDRDPAPGTFELPAGATLVLSEQTEFINTVDSTTVIDGDLVVRDGAAPTDVQIFNRGTMSVGGGLSVEAMSDPSSPVGTMTNNGDLVLSDGARIALQLDNSESGLIILRDGDASVGETDIGSFSNDGTVAVTSGRLHVNQWESDTLRPIRFSGAILDPVELVSGTWELENSTIFTGSADFGSIEEIGEGVRVRLTGDSHFHGLPFVGRNFFNSGTLELEDITFEVRDGHRFVNEGRLRLNNATIEALFVQNLGEVEIGASPGIGTIDGNFENAGVLEIELAGTQPGTGYDQLIVNGTTTFQPGGLISITLLDPDENDGVTELFTPRTGDEFEIIVTDELVLAAGVDAESILSFTNAPGGLRFDVDLSERDGLFSLTLNAQFGIEQGLLDSLSGNALAAGHYLDALLKSGSLDDDPRLDAIGDLALLDATDFPAVAAQWHPEIYAAAPIMGAFERVWALTGALERQTWRMAEKTAGGVWLGGVGAGADTDGGNDPRASGFDSDHSGVLFGGDVALGASGFVGGFVGREQHDQTFKTLPGDQKYDGNVYGIYGGVDAGWLDLSGYAAYQDGESDAQRRILGPSIAQTLGGEFDLDTLAVHVSGVWPGVWQRGSYAVRPVTAVTFIDTDRDAVHESGGSFALDVAAGDHRALFTDVGLTLDGNAEGRGLHPRLRAGWRFDADHERHRAAATLAGLGDADFVATGARLPRSMGYVSGSLTWVLDNRVSLFLGYDGTFAAGYSTHGGQLGIRIPL